MIYQSLTSFLIVTYAFVTLANFAIGANVPQNYKLCTTNVCRELANNISANLDTNVLPCNNFYQFACGGWIKNHPVNDNNPLTSTLGIIKKNTLQRMREMLEANTGPNDSTSLGKIRRIYDMCKNEKQNKATGMSLVINAVQSSGGSPMFPPYPYWNPIEHTTWQQISDNHPKTIYGNGLYRIIVDEDITDNDSNVILITKPNFFISRNKLIAMETDSRIKGIYMSYIVEISKNFVEDNTASVHKEMIARSVLELVEFEIELAKLSMKDYNKRYIGIKRTIGELQQEYDARCNSPNCNINWLNVMTKLFASENIRIKSSELVVVQSPKYLMGLIPLLEQTSSSTIANYVQWTFIRNLLPYVHVPMKSGIMKEAKNFLALTSHNSESVECTKELLNIFFTVISYEYTTRYVSIATINYANGMITDILNVIRAQIDTSTWTDRYMRTRFLDKLNAMQRHVSTPSWYNKIAIDEHYKDFIITSTDYATTLKELNIYETRKMMRRLRHSNKMTSKWSYDRWYRKTTMLIAYYRPSENAFVLYASILQDPVFNTQRPLYMNFGSLGIVIGHEINHGFDNKGYLFDKRGTYINWQQAYMDKYDQNSQCFVQQFNNYQINAQDSLQEILADSAGLVAAYKAYQIRKVNNPEIRLPGFEQYDDNQMFFLSFAQIFCENSLPLSNQYFDPHPTGDLRIIGSVSNFPEFSTAYNCPANVGMNPATKCVLWH